MSARTSVPLSKQGRERAVTEFSDLPQDEQINRYLKLIAEARKHGQASYPGLPSLLPPDPRTIMLQEFAFMHAIVGALLFLVAVISSIQAIFGNLNGYVAKTA